MKKNYKISLNGCDDSTYMTVGLTDKERTLIEKLSDLSKESSEYGCMPTMSIEEYSN